MDQERELALFRFLAELGSRFDTVRDADKALRIGVRMISGFFEADAACIARANPGGALDFEFLMPPDARWDEESFGEYLGRRQPKQRRDTLLWPILRRGRTWGVLGVRRTRGEFDRADVVAMRTIAQSFSRSLLRIDRMHIDEVRLRIDRNMIQTRRAKDLYYQILHGLRALTSYDHSAALFTLEPGPNLHLAAEQIAWHKGGSHRIGSTQGLDPRHRESLLLNDVFGCDFDNGEWKPWQDRGSTHFVGLLPQDDEGPSVGSALCAPLVLHGEALGIIQILACRPGFFSPFEVDLVRRFVPRATAAIRNRHRTESLEAGMIEAEKKHAMAGLARGVSHDINNAFGAILPLVQQMIADVREGRMDNDVLLADLSQIESSMQVCRRIFGGMLSFATGSTQRGGAGDMKRAVDSTLAILDEGLRRRGIAIDCPIPDELPAVRGSQGDLEQLVLNLLTNARDAMPDGGQLTVRSWLAGEEVRLSVLDTGTGIDPADLTRVLEPFFTTKPGGSGLGLSICRSIVWNMRGRLELENAPAGGTKVLVSLPAVRTGG